MFLYLFNVALGNNSVMINVGGGVPLADFWMLRMYNVHNGFKISMLLKYNLLLVTTLITCQLNIFDFLNDQGGGLCSFGQVSSLSRRQSQ